MIAEVVLALLVGALALLYQRWTRKYGTLEKLGIPVKAPFLCFGSGTYSLHKYMLHTRDQEILKDCKTIGYYDGSVPVILTVDPDLVKEVCIKQFDNFQERFYFPVRDDSCKTLDMIYGEEWSFLRKYLSPVFTSGKIKAMVDPIEECSSKGLRYLNNKARNSGGFVEVDDLKKLLDAITLEGILRIAFGVEGNLIGDHSLNLNCSIYTRATSLVEVESSKNYFEDALFLLSALEPDLVSLLLGSYVDNMKYYSGLVANVMKQRDEQEGHNTGDFIDRLRDLLKTVDEAGGKLHGVSPEMVKAQGSLFLLAGFETTASTLTNLVNMLSKNQEAQEKCYQDVCANASSVEDVNYESIGNMKYVEACVNETLRLFPVVHKNSRMCAKDVNVLGMEVKKGVRVEISTYTLNRHKDFYGEDAETFNPDRFITGGKSASDITFHTFGVGPKHCLGMRFAMVEMKMLIAKLLMEFEILDDSSSELEYSKGNMFMLSITKSKATLRKRAK